LYRRLGGPQSRSEQHGEGKILDPTGTRTPTSHNNNNNSQNREYDNLRFEVVTEMTKKIVVSWNVTPCSLPDMYNCTELHGVTFQTSFFPYVFAVGAQCMNSAFGNKPRDLYKIAANSPPKSLTLKKSTAMLATTLRTGTSYSYVEESWFSITYATTAV
jgi:hypothetical protein